MKIENKIDENGYHREYITLDKMDWYVNFDFELDIIQDNDVTVWKQLSTDKRFVEDSDDEFTITLREVFKVKVKQDYWI